MKRTMRSGTLGVALVAACTTLSGMKFTGWSVPVNLGTTVNSAAGDFHSFESKDGLALYFSSPRPGGYGGWDLWVAQRARTSDPWGAPQNLGPAINSAGDDGAPFVTPGGHELYFSSSREGGLGGHDLYVSRRHNRRDDFAWQPPVNLGEGVNSPNHEATPALHEDEASGVVSLYFASDRPGGPGPCCAPSPQGTDIYASTLQPDGTFGAASLVHEVSTAYTDRAPFVSRDGRELFLTSDAPGTIGGLDLWVSTRASAADPWSPPENLGPVVNGSDNDARAALSWDRTRLYFQSIRPGNVPPGFYDLWVTTRERLPAK
jgi:hypothetical protein